MLYVLRCILLLLEFNFFKVNIKCAQCFYKLFNQRKEGKLKITKNKQRRRIAADMKVKVKHTALTGYLKPKESEEKRENSNNPPPHHGVTGITGVTTRRLTGGKISSPSQPYNFPAQFNSNPNQTYLNKLIKSSGLIESYKQLSLYQDMS